MKTEVKCPKHDKFMHTVCGELVCGTCWDEGLGPTSKFPEPPPMVVQVYDPVKHGKVLVRADSPEARNAKQTWPA